MKPNRLAPALLAVLLLLIRPAASHPTASAAPDETWIEIASPNFTVVSNASEDMARRVAWQFEQIRAGIRAGWPWAQAELDRPFLVLGVRNEDTMRLFAPGYWEGRSSGTRPGSVSAHGLDRHYMLLRTDLRTEGREGVNPYQHAYWGYTSTVLSDSFEGRLPLWFGRGLSNVLSNTNVTDDQVQFGRPMPAYIAEVMRGRLALEEVLTMTRESPAFTREIERRRFDAQSWAVIHYLLFGETNGQSNAAQLNQLSQLVLSGTPSTAAVEQVFGSVGALDEAYRRYLERGSFRYSAMNVDASFDRKAFAVRPVSEAEALALRASYLVVTNRLDDARAAIDEAKAMTPELAGTFAAEGRLFDRRNDRAGAQAAYEQAVALGTTEFYSYYRLASLLRAGASRDGLGRMRELLTKAVDLNPAHAPAYSLLGIVALQMNEPEEAIVALRRSTTIDPMQGGTRLTLANALLRTGDREAALREAQAALALARSDQQRAAAQSLIGRIGGGGW